MEDIVSDVFLAALRKLPRFRYQGIPLQFWLLRIATNAVNRWARRQRRSASSLDADQLEDPSTGVSKRPTAFEIDQAQHALLKLSPKNQAVLSLFYFEDLSVKEVAAVLKCREGTVKSRLARARDALRAKLIKGGRTHERI
jgi:RNA polymerase sigma-70 factor (ECF subfamily)